jgi:hypothetical protein
MSMTLVPAVGSILERVLDDTHPLWHDGLSRENYGRYWQAQLKTAWGGSHLDRVALVDGPQVLASAKRYDFSFRLDGRIRRVLGIGAVFTPPEFRRRGAASELLARIVEASEVDGYEFAALFAEIAPAFYERLRFMPVPVVEQRLEIDRKSGGAPAVLVRAGHDSDLPAIVEMNALRTESARLALDRREAFVQYGIVKKRLLAGLGPPGLREVEFLVAEEGHRAVAYLVSVSHGGTWTIEEAGDRDPSGARLGAMLQVMLARHPGEAVPEIRTWWPATLTPPQVRIVEAKPTSEVLMIRPLVDRALPLPPLAASDVAYWHADYF